MKFLDSAPPPVSDKVTDQGGMLTAAWREWFMRMPDTLSAIPSRINVVELSGQTSSLAATDFSGGALKAGLYRATYYARLTAGSLAVTFSWTDGGAQSVTNTSQTETAMFRCDAGTAVTYATGYTGTGSYSLDVVLERLKA